MSTGATAGAVRVVPHFTGGAMVKDGAGNGRKGKSWERERAEIAGGKRERANRDKRQPKSPDLIYADTINDLSQLYASEYWILLLARNDGRAYSPDQRCRCPQCLADVPDSSVDTPDGPMAIMDGGRLWPRQAAEVMGEASLVVRVGANKTPRVLESSGCHFECRQIQIAPVSAEQRTWKRRRHRQGEDDRWCAGERGCWRRRAMFQVEQVKPFEVRIRQGRARVLIGFETTSVVAAVEQNSYAPMFEQVNDPELLAEVNGICREGEMTGLLDIFPEAGHASVKVER